MSTKLLTALLAVGLWSSAAFAADLSAFKVFPNPVHVNRGEHTVGFDGVTASGDLKIYNTNGRLVFETSFTPTATTLDTGAPVNGFVWKLQNNGGKDVASGIYVYQLNVGGDERTGKIGIIR